MEEGAGQGRGRGQGNFKLAANFGYGSRGSADPRESLRKRRILKLALTAHKVLPQTVRSAFWLFIGCNCGERQCWQLEKRSGVVTGRCW